MEFQRIAVLVDGDNISPVHATHILSQAAKLGRVDIARSYVNGAHPSDWLAMAGYQGMHAGLGKNSADLLLSIDAMEFALVNGIERFVIATSDGDFSHLAHRLREIGVDVRGMGEAKAPIGFRKACSAFEVLAVKTVIVSEVVKPTRCQVTQFDKNIRAVIGNNSHDGGGIRISCLSTEMKNLHGTQISETAEKTWRAYLAKRPALFDLDPRGPEAKVRFRMAGFTAH